ncbi:MAG: diacylglycerol kinase family lipid kinase [Lachnospiraceae bacterium]|jgi:YegS/Rv2252/BmrU family lipid kinase|nr:diacylglycerol kinase family lipid kinase [Lachnospiraceae bacterium]
MYHIIVNPAAKSGRGGKIWEGLEPILIERSISYDVVFSKRAGHVSHYVRKLTTLTDHSGPIRLIVLGGDGTLNETLQGIADFDKVELGYIPAGSSNDMARDLCLPSDPQAILDIILSGQTHRIIDIGSISGKDPDHKRYFAVSSGIGFDAAVCEEAFSSRWKKFFNKIGLGKLTYLAIALKQILTAKKVACNIYLDNNDPVHYKKFLFVAAMIHQYEGGGFKFCPGADATDGWFDVCVVGGLPKALLLLALPTAFFGKHFIFPGIDRYRCKAMRVETSAPLWVHTDGEVEPATRLLSMTCHHQQLHLIV